MFSIIVLKYEEERRIFSQNDQPKSWKNFASV